MIEHLGPRRVQRLEVARSLFFRSKGAYVVGLAHTDGANMPFVLALTNPSGRVVVDAALFTEDEVSVVFSFARSYFSVDMERPAEMIEFLRRIMPRKPVAELYNALGFNKHGKTELFRSLLRHLDTTDDRFVVAAGQRGMVMLVFTLPGFDVVFKVIRDRFAYPKTVTHQEVRDKYRLVFRSDRAGRLVDAQEFEHLAFDAARFEPGTLRELETDAAETVHRDGDRVVFRHLYTERRLRPLDLYLREAEAAAAREAVIDYGQVLRDLAATNIFPGDMLLKNFGVSRHGRLIFYDYDELVKLSDCVFRDLPQARTSEQETAAEPWFFVGEHDIFPAEFRSFLGLSGELLETFLAHHAELLDPAYWRRMQQFHARGEVLDVYPYRSQRRLRGAGVPADTARPIPRGARQR
jgi:isocitrate dehydrogenase kinase/phosphatase